MTRTLRILGVLLTGLLLAGLFLYRALLPPDALALPEPGFRLEDVTVVVPGADGSRRAGMTLRGEGERIVAVEAASGQGGPFAGHTVLPGLTDMHVHFPPTAIPGQSELFAFLFLYHGITAVRDAGDVDGKSSEPARLGIRGGHFPGPRVFSCGPFIDGDPPLWGNSIVVGSPDEARAAVRQVASRGYECVKAYNGLEADEIAALRAEARGHGLPVIGHVPPAVPYEVARLDDVQHLIGTYAQLAEELEFPFILKSWLQVDAARRDFVLERSLALGIANTPTLVTTDRLLASRDYAAVLAEQQRELAMLPRFYRDVIWNPASGLSPARMMTPDDFEMVAEAQKQQFRMVQQLHAGGAELHSGTDTLVSFLVPGAALHRELRLLERAGIPAEDVLEISSVVSARYLGVQGLGTIDVGAPAELVVFREDPTRDLAALDTLSAVVRGGRLYTREMLDTQLERYQSHFDGAVYDAVLTPVVRRVLAATLPD